MVWDRSVGQSCLAHPPENRGLVSHCLVGGGSAGHPPPRPHLPPRKHLQHWTLQVVGRLRLHIHLPRMLFVFLFPCRSFKFLQDEMLVLPFLS